LKLWLHRRADDAICDVSGGSGHRCVTPLRAGSLRSLARLSTTETYREPSNLE
jgi:hypothetical protein